MFFMMLLYFLYLKSSLLALLVGLAACVLLFMAGLRAGPVGIVLGLAFVIPLRKQMIDFDRLAYPGGIAVATILKSPGAGVKKAVLLLGGALFSGISTLLVMNYVGDHGDWPAGAQAGLPSMLNVVLKCS